MPSDSPFPLYVFEKDDWSMFLVESRDKLLYHIEPIDFENNEYLFWDADGLGVYLTLERGELTKVIHAENEISLHEAFVRYSRALGATVDTTGTPAEAWKRLQACVKPQSWRCRIARNTLGFGCSLIAVVIAVFVLALFGSAIAGVIRAIFSR